MPVGATVCWLGRQLNCRPNWTAGKPSDLEALQVDFELLVLFDQFFHGEEVPRRAASRPRMQVRVQSTERWAVSLPQSPASTLS